MPMNSLPALAILRDGSRIPVSDALDEARRLWRDQQYDADVVAIEQSGGATDTQTVAMDADTQIRTEGR